MKIFIIDSGIYLAHALKLAKEGHEVHLYSPWYEPYPSFSKYAVGMGFENIIKEDHEDPEGDEDLILFPDNANKDLVKCLREQGLPVFGAGVVEDIELNRIKGKEVMKELGIKYPSTTLITGTENLISKLKPLKSPKYVKLNTFRGDQETTQTSNDDELQFVANNINIKFGPFAKELDFIVEDPIDGTEIGCDTFFNKKKFIKPYFFTFECKGNTIGKWMNKSVWDSVLDKFIPYLIEQKFTGAFSLEAMYDGKDLYVLDITARFPSPGGTIYSQFVKGYGEVLKGVVEGEDVKIEYGRPYQSCIRLLSSDARGKWVILNYSKDVQIQLRRVCKQDDKIYNIPLDEELVCTVHGQGDTIEEMVKETNENNEKVEFAGKEFDSGIFFKVKDLYVKPLKELGIDF
jgi:phosphoribosylamine-glycine ligase